jgi:acyl dehydratase
VPQQKIEYDKLNEGYEFPKTNFSLDLSLVRDYIEAVSETSTLYKSTDVVPPMAIVALAMAELSKNISFPSGAIHVSQAVEFLGIARMGDTVTSHARISRNQKRGAINILSIELNAFDKDAQQILTGKTEFILSSPASTSS